DSTSLPGLGVTLPLSLTAGGVLAPATDVTGTLTAQALGEAAQLHVSSQSLDRGGGMIVTLTWRDLLAAFDTASGQLRLTGEAALGDTLASFLPQSLSGLTATVEATDLTWSRDQGFSGSLEAVVDAPVLEGTGIGRPLVLHAAPAPRTRPEFAGDLAVRLDVATS